MVVINGSYINYKNNINSNRNRGSFKALEDKYTYINRSRGFPRSKVINIEAEHYADLGQ